jgi:aspartate/methionine/tyrosine aminotransferase
VFPRLSTAAESVPLSIFARLYERLARFSGDVVPLHIGDTYRAPPPLAQLAEQGWAQVAEREIYAYAPPAGWTPLLEALRCKLRERNCLEVGAGQIQVTAGATHALACAVGALLDPGDEIMLLTPHWPLIKGIAQSRSAVPVEVPFTLPMALDRGFDPEGALAAACTPRTSAIYVSSPNNPDGVVMERAVQELIVRFAARHDLWILSDEVYEDYSYGPAAHCSIATLPGAAERTVSVFSFSKSYAQAGLRVGYAVGPSEAIAALRKMANHSVYNVPQAMQRAALAALTTGAGFLHESRALYRQARDLAHAQLRAPARLPDGATYLFVDLRGHGDSMEVLERIADAGVLLAPGAAFGAVYEGWARLCFTAVPQDRLVEGIARINRVLETAAR